MFSYFHFDLFSRNLTWCLYPLVNSFLLFSDRLSLNCSIRCTFSAKHSGQKLIFVLPYTFSAIDHLILDIIWSSFNDHTYFDNFVLILYCSWLKSWLWFANWTSKDVSARPKYILVPLFALFSTWAWYVRFGARHWFCNGQFSLVRQLQPNSVVLGLLLCNKIIDDMLLMQLQHIFTTFLLKILCNLLDFGKCCFNNFKNVLPIFVITLGGRVEPNYFAFPLFFTDVIAGIYLPLVWKLKIH